MNKLSKLLLAALCVGPLGGCALPSGDVTLTASRQGPRQAACGPEA